MSKKPRVPRPPADASQSAIPSDWVAQIYGSTPRIYQERLLAYVDLLGWKELVGNPNDQVAFDSALLVNAAFQAAASIEGTRKQQFTEAGIAIGATIRCTHFSDTIVFSCEVNGDEGAWLAFAVQLVCRHLLEQGQYTRGAVVKGGLIHDENKIFGPALVEAHLIEKDVAKYPRIIVTEEAAPFLRRIRFHERHGLGPLQSVTDLGDGLTHLDLFPRSQEKDELSASDRVAAKKARQRGEADLARNARETNTVKRLGLKAKYEWLLRYIDDVLRRRSARPAS